MPATVGFGERLNAAMSAQWINQSDLAERSGVSRVTIAAWLSGQVPTRQAPVRKVAEALGVAFESLWGRAEIGVDDETRLARLEAFAQRVQQLLDELELAPAEELRVAEPAPQEYGVDARTNAPLAEGEKPTPAKKRRPR